MSWDWGSFVIGAVCAWAILTPISIVLFAIVQGGKDDPLTEHYDNLGRSK